MITLTLLVIGCGLAWAIARYNQSNKLFWILFTSFVFGIAGGSMYAKCNKNYDNKEKVVKVIPTHEAIVATTAPSVTVVANAPESYELNRVSKDTTLPNTSSSVSCLSEGNPITVNNPTNPKVCSHISTHLDY